MSTPVDPPSPIPDYLWPQRAPLADDDQRVSITTEEIRMVARILDEEKLSGVTLVTQREGSPWLELDVAVAVARLHRYALWRYTCSAYRIGDDGAVEDDPFLTLS